MHVAAAVALLLAGLHTSAPALPRKPWAAIAKDGDSQAPSWRSIVTAMPWERRVVVATTIDRAVGVRRGRRGELVVLVAGHLQVAADSRPRKRCVVVATTIVRAAGVRSGRRDELAVLVVGLLHLASAGRPRKRRVIVATTSDRAVGVRSGRRDELVVLVAGLLPVAAGSSSRKRRVVVATIVDHAVGVRSGRRGSRAVLVAGPQWPPAAVLGRGVSPSPPPSIMPSGSTVVAGTVLPFWS